MGREGGIGSETNGRMDGWTDRQADRDSSHLMIRSRFSACLFRSKNAIGPDGAKALALALKNLTALQTLDLRSPWPRGPGAREGCR